MSQYFDAASQLPCITRQMKLDARFLAATSLTFLKPRLKKVLRPAAARLAGIGITANQVTLTSLAGSIAVGAALCANPTNTALFALLPLWLPIRTACASLDGTLAIEFGQKSKLGGILNEGGDIVSDLALFLPLAFVAPFGVNSIIFLISLTVLSEIAGIVGPRFGSDRRLEGPLGKVDRSVILAVLGFLIATFDGLPHIAHLLLPLFYGGLILTIWNRVLFAIADGGKIVE